MLWLRRTNPPLLRASVPLLLIGMLLVPGSVLGAAPRRAAQTPKAASAASIVLNSAVTIVVGSQGPKPVQLAGQDLQSDLEKVFGTKPKIVNRQEDGGSEQILIGQDL